MTAPLGCEVTYWLKVSKESRDPIIPPRPVSPDSCFTDAQRKWDQERLLREIAEMRRKAATAWTGS